jgi:hypothetical protein
MSFIGSFDLAKPDLLRSRLELRVRIAIILACVPSRRGVAPVGLSMWHGASCWGQNSWKKTRTTPDTHEQIQDAAVWSQSFFPQFAYTYDI